jgi:hypothetical protein
VVDCIHKKAIKSEALGSLGCGAFRAAVVRDEENAVSSADSTYYFTFGLWPNLKNI